MQGRIPGSGQDLGSLPVEVDSAGGVPFGVACARTGTELTQKCPDHPWIMLCWFMFTFSDLSRGE